MIANNTIGKGEDGEKWIDTALREFGEETGYHCWRVYNSIFDRKDIKKVILQL